MQTCTVNIKVCVCSKIVYTNGRHHREDESFRYTMPHDKDFLFDGWLLYTWAESR